MPALSRLVSGQNICFSGAQQFKNRKIPFRQNEKHREYLCVFPSIFMMPGRKFSFLNRVFSYLSAPLGSVCFYGFIVIVIHKQVNAGTVAFQAQMLVIAVQKALVNGV